MSKFSDEQTDRMLRTYYSCKQEEYSFSPPRRRRLTPIIAACLAVAVIAGVCFIPANRPDPDSGFIIVANAETLDEAGLASADEITTDSFVEIRNDSNTMVTFDFDCILDPDAKEFDLTQTYLFHSISMNLDFHVVGEDIESVTYKTNKGIFTLLYCPEGRDSIHNSACVFVGYDSPTTECTIDYDEIEKYQFSFNPIYNDGYSYDFSTKYYSYVNPEDNHHNGFLSTDDLEFSENSEELYEKYGWVSSFGNGIRTSAPTAATREEIDALRAYAVADDMVGFFNYQNKVFERIINEVTIDITVTKTDGTTYTKTMELCYTPDLITNAEGYLEDQTRTLSTGTISARLKAQ